jgi:hypothetical protein
MAYLATGDEAYMDNALRIIDAWARTNKVWGQKEQNGPLEAGWGECVTGGCYNIMLCGVAQQGQGLLQLAGVPLGIAAGLQLQFMT